MSAEALVLSQIWDNRSGPRRCVNTAEGLTRSSDITREGLGMKPTRTCSALGCSSPHLARGMCNAHYLKWRKTATDALPPKPCAVEGCTNPHASLGYCGTHAKNFRTYGDPIAPDRTGVNHPSWRPGHDIGYMGAHHRVRRRYGAPDAHACVDCGGPAKEWAYDHLDPNERIHPSRKGPIPFSANPAHYMPMCKSCHTNFDRRHYQLSPKRSPLGQAKEGVSA